VAEVEPAAEGVQLHAIQHHQRVIRLAAARKGGGHAAEAAGWRDRHARREPQGLGDHRHLTVLDVAPRQDRHAGGRLRLREFDVRGRHDDGVGERGK